MKHKAWLKKKEVRAVGHTKTSGEMIIKFFDGSYIIARVVEVERLDRENKIAVHNHMPIRLGIAVIK